MFLMSFFDEFIASVVVVVDADVFAFVIIYVFPFQTLMVPNSTACNEVTVFVLLHRTTARHKKLVGHVTKDNRVAGHIHTNTYNK